MNWLRWFYQLSWKKISGVAALLFLVAIIPLSLKMVNDRTRTRSEAALIHPSPQAITTKFETPAGPPKIYLVDHFFGKPGDAVLIHGENLGGLHKQSSVSLSGTKIPEENLVTWTGSYIEFKVPENAKSGQVEINILGQKTSWPGMFFVTNEQTQTEVNLIKNANNPDLAYLNISNPQKADELLVWLLIVNGDGNININGLNEMTTEQKVYSFPIGKVYEIKMNLGGKVKNTGFNQDINLLAITKNDKQVVGIARAELSTGGSLIPLKVNPLYVSF